MARQFTTPITLPADPASGLQAATKQYVDAHDWLQGTTATTVAAGNDSRLAPGPSDALNYGDMYTTLPRHAATFNASTSKGLAINGTIYICGGIATLPFLARVVRIATGATAGAGGTNTLQVGLYTGAGPSALTRQATITALSAPAANTLYQSTLSSTYQITSGMYVYIAVLSLATTTAATIASMNSSQSMVAGFINPDSAHYYNMSYSTTGQTTLPATANLTTGWGTSSLPFWAALSV